METLATLQLGFVDITVDLGYIVGLFCCMSTYCNTMLILSIVSLLTGLGLFMYGVLNLRQHLGTIVQGKLATVLSNVGHNRYLAASVGAVAAASMQSSGATSAIAIGLVDKSKISIFGASSIILGANVGTTVLGLAAASGALKIGYIFGVLTLLGSLIVLLSRNTLTQHIGQAVAGFGLVFVGMYTMSSAWGQAEISHIVGQFLSNIHFMPLIVLVATLCAGLLQSSSATIALAISMVASNTISLYTALFVVLGADAGTCVVALIASIGTSKDARRVAILQLVFNILGVILFGTLLMLSGHLIVSLLLLVSSNNAIAVSVFHILFNLISVLIALPLLHKLIAITTLIVP